MQVYLSRSLSFLLLLLASLLFLINLSASLLAASGPLASFMLRLCPALVVHTWSIVGGVLKEENFCPKSPPPPIIYRKYTCPPAAACAHPWPWGVGSSYQLTFGGGAIELAPLTRVRY